MLKNPKIPFIEAIKIPFGNNNSKTKPCFSVRFDLGLIHLLVYLFNNHLCNYG